LIQFSVEQEFRAGLDELWAAFGREDYVRRKYLELGATAVRVGRLRATPRSIEVDLERDVVIDKSRLPIWARALQGQTLTLRHRSAWRRADPTQVVAEIDVSSRHPPIRANGVGKIIETAAQASRMSFDWKVTAALPLAGRRVASLFAEQLRKALDDDYAFTLRYLAEAQAREPRTTLRESRR